MYENVKSLSVGHAPGVPSAGEGAGPRSPPAFAGSSVQEEEEPGLSGHFCPRAAGEPPTPQGLASLHTFPRQHELTQQRWQSVT